MPGAAAFNQAITNQADDVRGPNADNDERRFAIDIVVGYHGKRAPDGRQDENMAQVNRIRCVAKNDQPMWRCQLAPDLYPTSP